MTREKTKLILVTRRTRLDELRRRFNTVEQARFYIETLGENFGDYEKEDSVFRAALRSVESVLTKLGRVQVLDREFLPNFIFGAEDIVVVLGQDGLVANTIKYLEGQPVIGVNPDPDRWDGKLSRFAQSDLDEITRNTIDRRCALLPVTLAEARLNDGQRMLAVNDIFIGPKSHTSAAYTIQMGDLTERQSSSGVIISTGLGSTGWYTSLFAGAYGLVRKQAGSETSDESSQSVAFRWDADFLRFTVREPFPTQTTGTHLVHGDVTSDATLHLRSHMAENGVIFSDGIEADCIAFNSGAEVSIGLADRKGYLAA